MSLDADGRAVFRAPYDRCEIGVGIVGGARLLTACDGSGTMQTLREGAVLAMEPIEPLVGIIVRCNGEPVPSRLSWQPIGASGPPAPAACHVLARSDLRAARQLHFSTEATGERSCSPEALQFEGDLAYLDAERGRARAALTVLAIVPDGYRQTLGVRAEPVAGGAPIRIGHNQSPFDQTLPGGTYRLRWTCDGGAGPIILEQLELPPGEHREVTAIVPALETWHGHVRDQERLGMVALRFGDLYSVGVVLPGGTVPVVMPPPSRPAMPADLYFHALKMTLPVQAVIVDESSHTFEVVHGVTQADFVRLRSSGLGTGKRQIWLTCILPDYRVPAWLGPTFELPMLPGSERTGCLVEEIGQAQQVTCWFTVRHGAGDLFLEPRGHWVTLRIEHEISVTLQVEGWPGMDPIRVGLMKGPGEHRVFVADGTRAVHVVRPQGRLTFAPDLTEIVVR